MLKSILLLLGLTLISSVSAQIEIPDEEIPVDELNVEILEAARSKPLDLNSSSLQHLTAFNFLNSIQLSALIEHIRKAGKMIDILELQVIPGFDLITIKTLLPYVRVSCDILQNHKFSKVLFSGNYNMVFRAETKFPFSFSYKDTSVNRYLGSPYKHHIRFNYAFSDILNYSFSFEKDAGERNPADFTSGYLMFRSGKILDEVILGDYDVNLGQGLVCWTGFGFGKGTSPMMIKRISAPVRRYRSSDENHFFRGVSALLNLNDKFYSALFLSSNKLDASLAEKDSSQVEKVSYTSIRNSGFHRNLSELRGKDVVRLRAAGFSFKWRNKNWHLAYNLVGNGFNAQHYSKETFRDFTGSENELRLAQSLDYHVHIFNFHFFGEMAFANHWANLHGVLISLHNSMSLSLLHRNYSPAYEAYYSSGFSENSTIGNEKGWYVGQEYYIREKLTLRVGFDFYKKPDVTWSSSFPASGWDFVSDLVFEKRRSSLFRLKFKYGQETVNGDRTENKVRSGSLHRYISTRANNIVYFDPHLEWRTEIQLKWTKEKAWSRGFYLSQDLIYKPNDFPMEFSGRIGIFDSQSNSSKIYSRERDVLYAFSAPSYIGRGLRFYFLSRIKVGKNVDLWIRYSLVSYPAAEAVTSGSENGDSGNPDAVNSNKISELKLQLQLKW